MSELLPCPFCGGEAETCHVTQLWEPRNTYWAKCKNCHISGTHHKTEAEAIAAWNTRAERTCRMTDKGECSECGAYIVRAWTEVHDFNGDMKRIDLRSHNYCPNCGAKVVSE